MGKPPPPISEEEWQESKARTDEEWSRVTLPPGWREVTIPRGSPWDGSRAVRWGKSTVFFSAGRDWGKWWLHVSIAHPLKLPSYTDLAETKRIFIGEDRQAIQVFPKRSAHVNIHSRALHLWCCLEPEGDGLPAFGQYGTI